MRDGSGAPRRSPGSGRVEVGVGAGGEPALVAPNKGRRLQARRVGRRKLFDAAAKKVFLGWFAGTGNLSWAAKKAGVHYRTVLRHRMEDAEFGERYNLAEAQSVPRLRAWLAQAREEAEADLEGEADDGGADDAASDAPACETEEGEAPERPFTARRGAADGSGPDDAGNEAAPRGPAHAGAFSDEEDGDEDEDGPDEDEDRLAPGGDPSPENLSVEQAMRIVEAWEKRQARGPGRSGPAGTGHAAGRPPTVASNAEVREALVKNLHLYGIRVLEARAAAARAAEEEAGESEAEVRGPLHRPSCGHDQVPAAPGCRQPFRGNGGLIIPRSGEDLEAGEGEAEVQGPLHPPAGGHDQVPGGPIIPRSGEDLS